MTFAPGILPVSGHFRYYDSQHRQPWASVSGRATWGCRPPRVRDGSDLDLLVDALPGATLLDLGDLEEELKSLLGVDVDLLTPSDLPPKFRAKVLAEAQPV